MQNLAYNKFTYQLQISIVLLILITLQFPFIRELDYFNIIKRVLYIFIGAFMLLTLVKLMLSKTKAIEIWKLQLLTLIIFIVSLFNTLLFNNLYSLLNQILFMIFPLIAGGVISNYENKHKEVAPRLLNRIIIIALIIQLLSVLFILVFKLDLSQFSQGSLHAFKTLYTEDGSARLAGTLGHPIILAFSCIPLLFFSIYYYHLKKNILFLVLVLLSTYVILQTFSRGTWVGIFIAGVLYFFTLKFGLKIKIILSTLLGGVLLILVSYIWDFEILDRLSGLLSQSNNVSVNHRTLMIAWGIERYVNGDISLFSGLGYGEANTLALKFIPSDGFSVIDNSVISLLIELGVVNFIIIGLLLIRGLILSYKKRKMYFYILITMIITFLTFDLTSWYFPSFLFWLILGYLNVVKSEKKSERVEGIG